MSQGKRSQPAYPLFSSQSLGASFDSSSAPTNIQFLDNVGFLIEVTTANAVGVLTVYGGVKTNPSATASFKWADLALAIQPISGSNLVMAVPIPETFLSWIYLAYTRTSGTGTLSAWFAGKAY